MPLMDARTNFLINNRNIVENIAKRYGIKEKEDFFQEVILLSIKKKKEKSFQTEKQLKNYAIVFAIWIAKDWKKKKDSLKNALNIHGVEDEADEKLTSTICQKEFRQSEKQYQLSNSIVEATKEMSDQQKQILKMVIERKKHIEIARELNIKEWEASKEIKKIKKIIEKQLETDKKIV